MRLFTLEGKEKISCEIINNPPAMVAQVILKPGRDKNIRMRHPWVFSGAVERVTGAPQAGETVEVRSVHNDLLGMGAWSPQSQIQVRLWTVGRALIDADFFGRQLAAAIGRRTTLGLETGNSALRLVNAESDGLPGVVLDRYGDWLVLQCLTTGAEYWKATLVAWLSTQLPCRGIYERSDAEVRRKEGLEPVCGLLWGEMPPASVDIVEQGRQRGGARLVGGGGEGCRTGTAEIVKRDRRC